MAFPILSAISSCYSSFYSWLTSSSSFSDSSGFFYPKYPASSRSFLSCLRASQDSTVLGRGGVRYPYDILALISISGSFATTVVPGGHSLTVFCRPSTLASSWVNILACGTSACTASLYPAMGIYSPHQAFCIALICGAPAWHL